MSRRRRPAARDLRPPYTVGQSARAAIGIVTAFRTSVPDGEREVGRLIGEISLMSDLDIAQSVGNVIGYLALFSMKLAEENERLGAEGFDYLTRFALASESR